MDQNLKCIVLGEANCGKTSLINLFMTGSSRLSSNTQNTRYNVNFLAKLDNLVSNSSEKEEFKKVNSSDEHLNYSFKLYDYDQTKSNEKQFLKENELDKPDVLIYCYKSGSRLKETLVKSLIHKWGNMPIVLLSCKSDTLESTLHNLSFETTSIKLCSKFCVSLHLYCSSFKNFNVDKVFNESFKLAIRFRIKQMLLERENLLKKKIIIEQSKLNPTNEFLITAGMLKSSKLFMGFNFDEEDEKNSNTVVKSIFTLIGFTLFLFYMFTCKYYNTISINEMNLIKGVIGNSLSTLNSLIIQ